MCNNVIKLSNIVIINQAITVFQYDISACVLEDEARQLPWKVRPLPDRSHPLGGEGSGINWPGGLFSILLRKFTRFGVRFWFLVWGVRIWMYNWLFIWLVWGVLCTFNHAHYLTAQNLSFCNGEHHRICIHKNVHNKLPPIIVSSEVESDIYESF